MANFYQQKQNVFGDQYQADTINIDKGTSPADALEEIASALRSGGYPEANSDVLICVQRAQEAVQAADHTSARGWLDRAANLATPIAALAAALTQAAQLL